MPSKEYSYEELKGEYGLPEKEELEKILNISIKSKIKNKKSFIKNIIKKTYSKLKELSGIFEDVLNPDLQTLASMYETKLLRFDTEKVWDAYKKSMRLIRKCQLLSLRNYDCSTEDLKELFDGIKSLQPVAEEILMKKIEMWGSKIEYKKPREYLG